MPLIICPVSEEFCLPQNGKCTHNGQTMDKGKEPVQRRVSFPTLAYERNWKL